jgi:hypothetical protein
MNKIVWSKWVDPLESLSDDDKKEKEYDDNQVNLLVTPFGVTQVTNSTLLSKQMNLWIGETNFDITMGIMDVLNKLDGIETLDILTRYRFRVGIGRLFNGEDTKDSIEYELNCESNSINSLDEETKREVQEYIESVKDKAYWVVFVLPNGEVSKFSSEEAQKETFFNNLSLMEAAQTFAGGKLISNVV